MRRAPLLLILVMLISTIPQTGGVSSETASASERANGLLMALERLANYTHQIGCISDEADALLERAKELYWAGQYNESINEALQAMRLYRSALKACGGERSDSESGGTNWVSVAESEVEVTANVLEYARKLIESGELSGEDLKNLEAWYNQTLFAYNAVKTSLEKNDTQDIVHKIAFLVTSREKLEKAINLAVKGAVERKAKLLGDAQLRRIDMLIERGANTTELLTLKVELEEAIKSGDTGEILRILKEVPRIMRELKQKGGIGGAARRGQGQSPQPGNSDRGPNGAPPQNVSNQTPGKGRTRGEGS